MINLRLCLINAFSRAKWLLQLLAHHFLHNDGDGVFVCMPWPLVYANVVFGLFGWFVSTIYRVHWFIEVRLVLGHRSFSCCIWSDLINDTIIANLSLLLIRITFSKFRHCIDPLPTLTMYREINGFFFSRFPLDFGVPMTCVLISCSCFVLPFELSVSQSNKIQFKYWVIRIIVWMVSILQIFPDSIGGQF